MKKQLLTTLLLMLFGMTAWAQSGSGWTDPSSEYQAQTVVYVAIDCGEYDMFYYSPDGYVNYNYTPEIAAFIDGELRVAGNLSDYQAGTNPANKAPIYALRVGGIADDEGKEITFKIYDDRSGIIYPLTYEGEAITYMGDFTPDYPSNYYTMTFTPATEVKLFTLEADMEIEINNLSIRVNETKPLDNYYAKVYDAQDNEIEVEAPGFWDIQNNPNRPYVQKIEAEDGSVQIKGMQETPKDEATGENRYMECAYYVVGSLYAPVAVQVLPEYFPVTSIAIEDVNYYWKGYGRLGLSDDMVTYNNGDTYPTNPGVKIVSSSNPDIVAMVGQSGLNYKGIGSSVITVAAIDDESVTTTFTVNVLSGLEAIRMDGDNTYFYNRYSSDEEIIDLPTPLFDWIMDESGAPVVGDNTDESYTMSSNSPDIVRIDEKIEGDLPVYQIVSLKKGTATITYTSTYDPTKTATLTVIVSQYPSEVKITKVGATEVTTGGTTEPIIDVALGQEVTAVVRISPNDADYETFDVSLVNDDDIPYEADVVEVGEPVANGDGTYNVTFKFIAVPNRMVRLKAVVDGQLQDRVQLNVINSVVSITPIPEELTLWLTEEEFGQHTGTIDVTVLPEDATDKSLTISSSDDDIVSIELTDNGYTYTVNNKGTATLTFISNDNPSVSAECVITVKKKVTDLMVDVESLELYSDGRPQWFTVTVYPTDADYNVDNLTARVETGNDMVPTNWEFVTIHEYDIDGGKHYGVTGRSLNNNGFAVLFEYDTTEQGDEEAIGREIWTRVIEKVNLYTGWNWVSFISAGLSTSEMAGSLEEARSQTSLVIDDPNWGLFGNLDWMDTYEAYKIKMKEEAEMLEYILMEGGAMNEEGNVDEKVLEHGWNWVSYPYEYEYYVADIFDPEQFADGDIILSKEDGMVTLTEGAWEGNLINLIPNQGYLIYSNTEGEYSVTMPNRYTLKQGYFQSQAEEAPNRDRSVWSYDGSRFANTMAIIGTFNIEDAADYTIGAFVGDECRGEGKFVNGRAYITAAGEAGEMVTLRLYNTWTGEYFEVAEEVAFTDLAGSVKAPVSFTRGETAIDNVVSDALTIQGHVATADGTIQVYDVQGKVVVEGFQRVDLSHLNSGVYVVKAGDASRKVIK